jgi:hypothetical protein
MGNDAAIFVYVCFAIRGRSYPHQDQESAVPDARGPFQHRKSTEFYSAVWNAMLSGSAKYAHPVVADAAAINLKSLAAWLLGVLHLTRQGLSYHRSLSPSVRKVYNRQLPVTAVTNPHVQKAASSTAPVSKGHEKLWLDRGSGSRLTVMSIATGCGADAVALPTREMVGRIIARWFTRRGDRKRSRECILQISYLTLVRPKVFIQARATLVKGVGGCSPRLVWDIGETKPGCSQDGDVITSTRKWSFLFSS